MPTTVEFETIDQAREHAARTGGRFYVLAPETLAQIEAAEAAGGFEGGMTGASGEGGHSAPGVEGPNFSSASDPPPTESLDLEGAVPVGGFIEGAIEKYLDARDLYDAVKGFPLGPIILVPTTELRRWLYGEGPIA